MGGVVSIRALCIYPYRKTHNVFVCYSCQPEVLASRTCKSDAAKPPRLHKYKHILIEKDFRDKKKKKLEMHQSFAQRLVLVSFTTGNPNFTIRLDLDAFLFVDWKCQLVFKHFLKKIVGHWFFSFPSLNQFLKKAEWKNVWNNCEDGKKCSSAGRNPASTAAAGAGNMDVFVKTLSLPHREPLPS